MGFSSAQSTNVERLLSENNNKLKQGFHNLCCKLDALAPSGDSKDFEPIVGYNPTTGELVISTYGYNADGTFTITNTNPDGTPYTGPTPIRGEKDFELSTKEWFCVNNTDSISRVDIFVDGIFTSSIWQSLDGSVIAAPTSGTYTPGVCVTAVAPLQSFPLRDDTYHNEVNFYSTTPGTNNLLQESSQVLSDFINNGIIGPEYTQTVRIVSDSKDIVRTETINITTNIVPICYTHPNTGNLKQSGFLITETDHLGYIINSWVVAGSNASGSQSPNSVTPIDRINSEIVGVTVVACTDDNSTAQRTPIPCAFIIDTRLSSGYRFVKDGFLIEDTSSGVGITQIPGNQLFVHSDGVTNTRDISQLPGGNTIDGIAFIANCPETVCIEQNGIQSKAFKVIVQPGTSSINNYPNNIVLQAETFYFDTVTFEGLETPVFPITEIPCTPEGYNNVKHEETSSTPIVIPANTVHSISYKIIQGVVDITIGLDTLSYQAGEADTEEATALINQEYTFTPQVGGLVKIKTIY